MSSFNIGNGSILFKGKRMQISNAFITGVRNTARDEVYRSLIVDSLDRGTPVVFIQNGSMMSGNNLLTDFESYEWGKGGYQSYYYNLVGNNDDPDHYIDLLAGMDEPMTIECIITLMKELIHIDADGERFFRVYLNNLMQIINALKDPGLVFCLSNLHYFTKEWMEKKVRAMVKTKKITASQEQNFNTFLGTYLSINMNYLYEWVSFCQTLEMYNFAKSLSGSIDMDSILNSKSMTCFTLDYLAKSDQSRALTKILMRNIINRVRYSGYRITVVFEEVDISMIEEFRMLISTCYTNPGCNVYFNDSDISTFKDKAGYEITPMVNTYFIFNQSNSACREYWSSTCGRHQVTKQSTTVSPREIRNVWDVMKRNNRSVTTMTEDEYIVKPDEFSALDPNTCIVLYMSGQGETFHTQVKWK